MITCDCDYNVRRLVDETIDEIIDMLMAASHKNREQKGKAVEDLKNALNGLVGLVEYLEGGK